MRIGKINRKTNETKVDVEINLDGAGKADIDSGVGFFNHMLNLFAAHGQFDLEVICAGDLEVDGHHSVEDIGIAMGAALKEALGDKAFAITAQSCSFPKRERDEAKEFCSSLGIRQVTFESDELNIEGFSQNPPNRCYLCKRELFGKMIEIAESEGAAVVVEGSNLDDEGDYRPGLV